MGPPTRLKSDLAGVQIVVFQQRYGKVHFRGCVWPKIRAVQQQRQLPRALPGSFWVGFWLVLDPFEARACFLPPHFFVKICTEYAQDCYCTSPAWTKGESLCLLLPNARHHHAACWSTPAPASVGRIQRYQLPGRYLKGCRVYLPIIRVRSTMVHLQAIQTKVDFTTGSFLTLLYSGSLKLLPRSGSD